LIRPRPATASSLGAWSVPSVAYPIASAHFEKVSGPCGSGVTSAGAMPNFAFGRQDNKEIFVMAANNGTFWRFKTPNPGLIGPGGNRVPEQK
jgi:hypothetical protein